MSIVNFRFKFRVIDTGEIIVKNSPSVDEEHLKERQAFFENEVLRENFLESKDIEILPVETY